MKKSLLGVSVLSGVMAGRTAALFFQIESRLYALIDRQAASERPLVIPGRR